MHKLTHIHIMPKKTPVSRNTNEMKNIYLGGHRFTFFNQFFRDILLSSLVSFAFFVFLFFFACSFF